MQWINYLQFSMLVYCVIRPCRPVGQDQYFQKHAVSIFSPQMVVSTYESTWHHNPEEQQMSSSLP
jgi:hypothetical protein